MVAYAATPLVLLVSKEGVLCYSGYANAIKKGIGIVTIFILVLFIFFE
jgi:hypothetical protein